MTSTIPDEVLAAHRAGINVLPPKRDGSKSPDVKTWTEYQTRRVTDTELHSWYPNGRNERVDLGFVTGAGSRGLELTEFEALAVDMGLPDEFLDAADAAGLGDLVSRVFQGYLSRSPANGLHLLTYCVDYMPGSAVLAALPAAGPGEKAPVLIETRGNPGYTIEPPSGGGVHESGKPYELLAGGVATIETITAEERRALHDLARSFDRRPPKPDRKATKHTEPRDDGVLLPGTDYNQRGPTCLDQLVGVGWHEVYTDRDGRVHLRRPGADKRRGISGNVSEKGAGVFFCWTSSMSPFEAEQCYDRFGVYALLNHSGDFGAAAKTLYAEGFGDRAKANGSDDQGISGQFFDGDTFVPARLGAFIRDEGSVRLGHDGRLYRYDSGVYRGDGDTFVRAQVCALLGERVRRRHQDEVMAWMRATFPTISDQPPVDTLNVANGLLDWRTGELRAHQPDFLSCVQLPVAWRPEATCPVALKFLGDVTSDDSLDFVTELLGYAIYPGNPFAKAVLLLGPGGNGKSKLLALTRALCGERNTVTVTLQAFAENRFAAAEVFGKLANICGDLDARAIKRTDLFKMLTGGDTVPAERKYAHPFRFTSFALPVFSANEAPISSDQSEAWFDRWLVVPMETRFRGTDDDDPDIEAKITAPSELEGLLVLAVVGLRRLLARGRFDAPAPVRAAGEHYRSRLDTVRAFIEEECVLHPDTWVNKAALYRAYRTWAQEGGRLPVSAQTFTDHVRRNYDGQVADTAYQGDKRWRGLGLATPGGSS